MDKPFTWGTVIDRHKIGPYSVVEYDEYATGRGRKPTGRILFHGYIDGSNSGESWETLDAALAGLIVRRALGQNHRQINEHFIAGIEAMKSRA